MKITVAFLLVAVSCCFDPVISVCIKCRNICQMQPKIDPSCLQNALTNDKLPTANALAQYVCAYDKFKDMKDKSELTNAIEKIEITTGCIVKNIHGTKGNQELNMGADEDLIKTAVRLLDDVQLKSKFSTLCGLLEPLLLKVSKTLAVVRRDPDELTQATEVADEESKRLIRDLLPRLLNKRGLLQGVTGLVPGLLGGSTGGTLNGVTDLVPGLLGGSTGGILNVVTDLVPGLLGGSTGGILNEVTDLIPELLGGSRKGHLREYTGLVPKDVTREPRIGLGKGRNMVPVATELLRFKTKQKGGLTSGLGKTLSDLLGSVTGLIGDITGGLLGTKGGFTVINDRLFTLSNEIGELTEVLGQLSGGIEGLSGGFGGVSSSLNGVTGRLDGLTGGLGAVTDGLNNVKFGLDGLKGGVNGVSSGLNKVTGSLDGLSGKSLRANGKLRLQGGLGSAINRPDRINRLTTRPSDITRIQGGLSNRLGNRKVTNNDILLRGGFRGELRGLPEDFSGGLYLQGGLNGDVGRATSFRTGK